MPVIPFSRQLPRAVALGKFSNQASCIQESRPVAQKID